MRSSIITYDWSEDECLHRFGQSTRLDRRCQITDRPVRLALHKALSVDDGSDPVGSDGGIEGHIDTCVDNSRCGL